MWPLPLAMCHSINFRRHVRGRFTRVDRGGILLDLPLLLLEVALQVSHVLFNQAEGVDRPILRILPTPDGQFAQDPPGQCDQPLGYIPP